MPAIVSELVAAAIGLVLQIVGPDKLSDMTDEIVKGFDGTIDMDAVKEIGLLLVFLYGVSAEGGAALYCVSQKCGGAKRRGI